jgi:hypothetical protein
MKLEHIGVVVLSHGRRDKLERSLKSYEENGLTEMVGDNFVFFNEIANDDISLIENDYKKFEWGGHPVNCGIGWGMIKAITECDAKYVLFLENDFELATDKDNIYRQLEMGYRNLEKDNIDIIKYREVKDYIHTSNEAMHWVGKIDLTGSSDSDEGRAGCSERNWWIGFAVEENFGYNNSDICEKLDEEDGTVLWRMSCKYANWSNNPFLCSKDWFLDLAAKIGYTEMGTPSNSRSPDFEEQIEVNGWWQKQDYRMGILPGLFRHQP